jgi:hypothetical protein
MPTFQTKLRPGTSKDDLQLQNFVPSGNTTVDKLIWLLHSYSHSPITPKDTLGPLVPSMNILGADVNHTWNIPKGYGYKYGDIGTDWTVQKLADDIDKKLAAASKAGAA